MTKSMPCVSVVALVLASALLFGPLASSISAAESGSTSSAASPEARTDKGAHSKGFRFGVELGAGVSVENHTSLLIGMFLDIGFQITDLWAVFWQPSLLLGGMASSADESAGVYLMTGQLVMADVTLGWFQFGAGAGVDLGGVLGCAATDTDCNVDSGVYAALGIRAAVLIGAKHFKFPIAIQYHPTFATNTVHSILLTIGIQFQ